MASSRARGRPPSRPGTPPTVCVAILRGAAAQHAREGRVLPGHVVRRMRQRRAVVSLEAERPDVRERALLAAEAARTANEEEL
eukprot:6633480-Alexandrium_andersonii.AAC.1